ALGPMVGDAGGCPRGGDRMRAVMHLAGHELRARWRSWAVLAALVAVAGGAVLAAVGGALRTDSAYPRLLTASKASDVLVAPDGSGLGGYFGALGRLPTAARAGEIAVDQRGAAVMGLRVGSVLTLRAHPERPPGASPAVRGPARPRVLRERVVGIVVTRGSVLPVTEQDKGPLIMASAALFHRLGVWYVGYGGAFVKLRPGASPEVFRDRAQSLTRRFPAT